MGQYWRAVNLDKKEYIDPYTLNSGAKLWEQLAKHPGVGAALIVLCAAQPIPRGSGDLDLNDNWHGPERTDMTRIGEMPEEYPEIARLTIGRWAGDRIALVGDYADDSDLAKKHRASTIYSRCTHPEDLDPEAECKPKDLYTDVTLYVKAVLDHEGQAIEPGKE